MNGRLHYTGFTLIFQEVMQEPESFYVKWQGFLPAAEAGNTRQRT